MSSPARSPKTIAERIVTRGRCLEWQLYLYGGSPSANSNPPASRLLERLKLSRHEEHRPDKLSHRRIRRRSWPSCLDPRRHPRQRRDVDSDSRTACRRERRAEPQDLRSASQEGRPIRRSKRTMSASTFPTSSSSATVWITTNGIATCLSSACSPMRRSVAIALPRRLDNRS